MTMSGIGMGIVIAVVAYLVIWSAKVMFSKKETIAYNGQTPEEAAAAHLTKNQKEKMIQVYAGKKAPFTIGKHIKGWIDDLTVSEVEAYGIKYNSMSEAVDNNDEIDDDDAYEMLKFQATLVLVRNASMENKKYKYVEEMLDESIIVYNPHTRTLSDDVRTENGLPARMAIKIVRGDNLKMSISSVLVSMNDVRKPDGRYELDMTDVSDVETFKLLIRGDKGKLFAVELAKYDEIQKHLSRFNELVENNRINVDEDGKVIIKAPTPAELKAKRLRTSPVVEIAAAKEEPESSEQFVSDTE